MGSSSDLYPSVLNAAAVGEASRSRTERSHAAWLHGSRRPCGGGGEEASERPRHRRERSTRGLSAYTLQGLGPVLVPSSLTCRSPGAGSEGGWDLRRYTERLVQLTEAGFKDDDWMVMHTARAALHHVARATQMDDFKVRLTCPKGRLLKECAWEDARHC